MVIGKGVCCVLNVLNVFFLVFTLLFLWTVGRGNRGNPFLGGCLTNNWRGCLSRKSRESPEASHASTSIRLELVRSKK